MTSQSRRTHLIWTLAATALVTACGQNKERTFAPAPGAATYDVEINPSAKLDSIETDHLTPSGEPTRVRCATCHDVVDVGEPAAAPGDLKEFHRGLQVTHGNLSCTSCHQEGEAPLLHLATGEKLPTTEAMQLCSQCHGPQRKSYDNGAHGGMNGHWDLSRGPRLRNNCVDCHDPHVPKIQQVMPAPRIIDRGHSPAPHQHTAPYQQSGRTEESK